MTIKLVVADDHAIMLEGLSTLISSQEGFDVIGQARNGVDAVKLAKTLRPDVVIMDIGMPDLDGIDATRIISEECPDTKVIALSVHSEHGFVTEMFRAGALGYLLKESALSELLEAIRAVHSGKKYLSDSIVDIVVGDVGRTQDNGESAFDSLTQREKEVLQMMLEGQNAKEIAFELEVSPKTVLAHRQQIMSKLGVDNLIDLTKLAIKHGLILP